MGQIKQLVQHQFCAINKNMLLRDNYLVRNIRFDFMNLKKIMYAILLKNMSLGPKIY